MKVKGTLRIFLNCSHDHWKWRAALSYDEISHQKAERIAEVNKREEYKACKSLAVFMDDYYFLLFFL